MFMLRLANFFAKYSCTRWNKSRLARRCCRAGYRTLSTVVTKLRRFGAYKIAAPTREIQQAITLVPADANNTYPWPYCDPEFAPWEEDDSPDGYSLITDPADFVIRRSTSYCAWKIYEATGRWPTNRDSEHLDSDARDCEESLQMDRDRERRRFDARDWEEFLQMNYCYKRPSGEDALEYAVGIIADEGEFGQVVWLESIYVSFESGQRQVYYRVSTYKDFQYKEYTLKDPDNIVWMEVSPYCVPPRGFKKILKWFRQR